MYFLEHPTRGILVEHPTFDKRAGTWSWSKPRSEAYKICSEDQARLIRANLPERTRKNVSIMKGPYPYETVVSADG